MKLIAIVGTAADLSYNRKLLYFMKEHFKDLASIDVCEIKGIPAFNKPDPKVDLPDEISELQKKIQEADGIIFGVPEYDHSIPAALKSVLEWLAYPPKALVNKPVLIIGGSYGTLGASRAQIQLRQILDARDLRAIVMPSSDYFLGHIAQAFNEENDMVDEEAKEELEELFERFLKFVQTVNSIEM
ncbi:NADPH-dependent FMN reductase [Hutsoniella sourekii]|uniref:NADPH-dependent FMN reductase n=1 Tax=Hutsoniella sourekii TaxID=87650 RepID=UPI0004B00EED|nr:NADPH-dependent FMN reductase [Hutsoniella sourekii]